MMMRRLLVYLLVLAVVLFAVAMQLIGTGVPWGVKRPFSAFRDSEYLQPLWSKSCAFNLNDTGNLVVMAHLKKTGGDVDLTCWWKRKPISYREGVGIVLNDTIVHMDRAWLGCGSDANFPAALMEAIYKKSSLICLEERPPRTGYGEYYVLVSKCSNWSGGCGCPPSEPAVKVDGLDVVNVAYAVLDGESGRVYW